MAERNKSNLCALPISRIKTIMKSSPDVLNIGQDSLFLIAKSTELFVQDLANMMREKSTDKHDVHYNDLAAMVDEQETLQFLKDIIPRKIKVRDFYALTGKTKIPAAANDE